MGGQQSVISQPSRAYTNYIPDEDQDQLSEMFGREARDFSDENSSRGSETSKGE
ncbi:hypothetical protein SS50377_28535 [Spironucleus salmonicida]|uniref:Uncharacterized protein n=1 Tax=Spironucleus salmonicida TaxID=348837 RepID=V6LBK5_9EUKA|nr:hypothetical protein SS50377_28535 [Spironucleus salmonicida]|eukprot:EST41633.1 Hypothetical protein SS50377_18989 [Spironucleus salmonicida]